MTAERRSRARITLGVLACSLACACGTTSGWTIRKPIASFTLPRATTVMVFRAPEVEAQDKHGASDALTEALRSELAKQGVTSTLMPLKGAPRTPRIELAFRQLEITPTSQYSDTTQTFEEASLVVDVGVVSPADEVVFVGRFVASAHRDRLRAAADAAGRKVAQDLGKAH